MKNETYLTVKEVKQAFSDARADSIPSIFIDTAVITTRQGEQIQVTGEQFHDFLKNDRESDQPVILEVRIALDIERVLKTVSELSQEIIDNSKREVLGNDNETGRNS